MPKTRLPASVETTILQALGRIGYGPELIQFNVPRMLSSSPTAYGFPIVAFCESPFDQRTSAIGVIWRDQGRSTREQLAEITKDVWSPITIIAKAEDFEVWSVFSDRKGMVEPELISRGDYSNLVSAITGVSQISPRELLKKKEHARQLALFEKTTEYNIFLEWAVVPTQIALNNLIGQVIKEQIPSDSSLQEKALLLRLLLRLFATRVAWDKGWLPGQTGNAEALASAARSYPNKIEFDSRLIGLANEFVTRFSQVNLRYVDNAVLSYELQTHTLLKDLRKDWRLHPTPPEIAWSMVQALPFETVDAENISVWDGTCGTGTLLAVTLERLRRIVGIESTSLRRIVSGNDQQPLLSDLTRIALDTVAGGIASPTWKITTKDVNAYSEQDFQRLPTVIVGNPPFGAVGKGEEEALPIVKRYLQFLQPGGLLAVVLPRSALTSRLTKAREVRSEFLEGFDLNEIWELPQGFDPSSSSEAMIIVGRKHYPYSKAISPTLWKMLDRHGRESPLTRIVPNPTNWRSNEALVFEHPLLTELKKTMETGPRLGDLLTPAKRTEGITPGRDGRDAIRQVQFTGAKPFLSGRTAMKPFLLPPQRQWIDYSSSKIWRARRNHEDLFRGRKLVLTRWSTGGSPWVVQAAVDESGFYPSEDFFVLSAEPYLSCDLLAGMFNSSLLNYWLRLSNPARTVRLEDCISIPLPEEILGDAARKVRLTAIELGIMWSSFFQRDQRDDELFERIKATTMRLDKFVFALYQVPATLQSAISQFFLWRGNHRPGFQAPMVQEPLQPTVEGGPLMPTEVARLHALLDRRSATGLSAEEERELRALTEKWQRGESIVLKRMASHRDVGRG